MPISPEPRGVKADKRAHHNALERKRRDHIKDSFTTLRDAVPILGGPEKARSPQGSRAQDMSTQVCVALLSCKQMCDCIVVRRLQSSRAQILSKATEYLQFMRRKNHAHQVCCNCPRIKGLSRRIQCLLPFLQQEMEELKRQNAQLSLHNQQQGSCAA